MATTARGVLGYSVLDGNMNSVRFCEFLRSLPLTPESVLLLDNAAYHVSAAVRTCAAGIWCALLFNIPYSPEFNPIEMTFNQIKSRFQKLHDWDEATRGVTEQHAFNTFQHVRGLLLTR
jgi:transposase